MLHPNCDPALNSATTLQFHEQQPVGSCQQAMLGPRSLDPSGPPIHAQPLPVVAPAPPVHYSSTSNTLTHQHQRHLQASASDPCQQIAHVLQCYQQGGDQGEFVRKAIESLVKKLKDKRPELDSLIEAVTTSGKSPTGCVTIQRSLDGRLQVAGKKGVPHVVYARIWRWPNVNKNELQKLSVCNIDDDNHDLICVNPYHYERVVSPGIGTIDMASLRLDQMGSGARARTAEPSLHSPHLNSFGVKGEQEQQLPAGHRHQQSSQQWSSCAVQSHEPEMFHPGYGVPVSAAVSVPNSIAHQQIQQQPIPQPRMLNCNVMIPQLPPPEHWASISYYELDTQIGETFKVRRGQTEVLVDGGMDPAGARQGRFCLGALPNVHRTEASDKARLHIGKGVRLSLVNESDVYLECLSSKAVFVRSYYLDFANNVSYGSTVYKFSSGSEIQKIFDLRWCYAEMKQQSQSAQLAVVAQAAAVAGFVQPLQPPAQHAGTGVDDLRRVCCTIGISFVKGWGPGYNRTAIKETPCWIEVQLHRALQLLDQVLLTMPGNTG